MGNVMPIPSDALLLAFREFIKTPNAFNRSLLTEHCTNGEQVGCHNFSCSNCVLYYDRSDAEGPFGAHCAYRLIWEHESSMANFLEAVLKVVANLREHGVEV